MHFLQIVLDLCTSRLCISNLDMGHIFRNHCNSDYGLCVHLYNKYKKQAEAEVVPSSNLVKVKLS